MSPITAALVAGELVPKVAEQMTHTPPSWLLSQTDELAFVSRHCQTLQYLQTCYEHVLRALPVSMKSGQQADVLRQLFQNLDQSCRESAERARELAGISDDQLKTVPKYYFSELRSRRQCVVPQAPTNLTESATLSFLSVEVMAGLRRAERFELLARNKNLGSIPREQWERMAEVARGRAASIVAALLQIFDEMRVEAELRTCCKEESMVAGEILDGSRGRVRFGAAPRPEEEDDEGEDDGEVCDITAALRPVFIVSDCTGESALHTVNSALAQFGHCFDRASSADMTVFRFCTEAEIGEIVEQAKIRNAFIVYTLVDPTVNALMVKECKAAGVEHHSLWGRLLEKLEGYFDATRIGIPGSKQVVDEKYMQMIECIEYTRTLDDGVLPHRWAEADIIILGPSRTGKTPLSFFMAQRGYKVANYPLVPDESLPKELWEFDQSHIFALTIDHAKLSSIRNNRMNTLKMGAGTRYAKASNVQQELAWCKRLYQSNPRWTVLDTTYAGIEENSAAIMRVLDGQGTTSRISLTENPSAI